MLKNHQYRISQMTLITAAGTSLSEAEIAGDMTSLLLQVFHSVISTSLKKFKVRFGAEFTSFQSSNNSFLCGRDTHTHFENKPDDNLAKQRSLSLQIKSQNEKTSLNIMRVPLWRQSKHRPWHKTVNSELPALVLETSKSKKRKQEMAEFTYFTSLGGWCFSSTQIHLFKLHYLTCTQPWYVHMRVKTRFHIRSLHLTGASKGTVSVTYFNIKNN